MWVGSWHTVLVPLSRSDKSPILASFGPGQPGFPLCRGGDVRIFHSEEAAGWEELANTRAEATGTAGPHHLLGPSLLGAPLSLHQRDRAEETEAGLDMEEDVCRWMVSPTAVLPRAEEQETKVILHMPGRPDWGVASAPPL